eukprot:SAG22_NODE_122_length_18920_cov_23.494076_20_plen_104_part_00
MFGSPAGMDGLSPRSIADDVFRFALPVFLSCLQEKNIRWAGANTWRTLEWMLPHPPPFHTFEEQPIIKETVGAATTMPRPPNYQPDAIDPFDHSYHPGTHQTL